MLRTQSSSTLVGLPTNSIEFRDRFASRCTCSQMQDATKRLFGYRYRDLVRSDDRDSPLDSRQGTSER
jgi:hypothetical protein